MCPCGIIETIKRGNNDGSRKARKGSIMTTREAYIDIIDKITTGGRRTTSCLAAATIANLYGLSTLNALEDAGMISYAGQNSNNMAVYIIA